MAVDDGVRRRVRDVAAVILEEGPVGVAFPVEILLEVGLVVGGLDDGVVDLRVGNGQPAGQVVIPVVELLVFGQYGQSGRVQDLLLAEGVGLGQGQLCPLAGFGRGFRTVVRLLTRRFRGPQFLGLFGRPVVHELLAPEVDEEEDGGAGETDSDPAGDSGLSVRFINNLPIREKSL